MARNAEKAMTTLARWRAAQVQEAGGQRERRPYLASECNNLQQAEKWRLQIVREIAKKVAQIQNDMDEEQIDTTNIPTTESLRESSTRSVNEPNIDPNDVFVEKLYTPEKSPKISSPVISPLLTSPPFTSASSPTKRSLNASIRSQRSIKSDIPQDTQIENTSNRESAGNTDILNKYNVNSSRQLSRERQGKVDSSPTKGSINMSIKSQKSIKDNLQNIQSEYKSNQDDIENPDNLNAINDKDANQMLRENQSEGEYESKLDDKQSPVLYTNINKIANMSRHLTNEANALRESIKSLSENIVRTRQELNIAKNENVNFPYHLFLIELIINKIHMKCDCFEFSYNNLVITATFLGKQPIILYDSSFGKIDDFSHLNVGKSALFAMTYDKICSIKEFVINLNLTKQPPCSNCVIKVAEAKIDCSKEYLTLRDELCKKWTEEQPKDNIMCTTSTPLNKNMCYLRSGGNDNCDFIGMMELTVRMSFLGKEITTTFSTSSKSKCTSVLTKEDNGMSMYTCQNVEMNGQGKILLDENTLIRKEVPKSTHTIPSRRTGSPLSHISSTQPSTPNLDHQNLMYQHRQDYGPKYNEIFTKLNENELRIRVPKTTKFERMGRYDKIQELCSCENTPYNTGDQIQIELPKDNVYSNEYAHNSNLKYTYNGCNKSCENKNRKIINVTPSNCPVPVNMEKHIHPQKDVFILKIGKKLETNDKKTDLEIELVTPKAPNEKPIENNNISQQCSRRDLKDKPSKSPKNKEKKRGNKSKTNLAKKKGKTQQKQKLKKKK